MNKVPFPDQDEFYVEYIHTDSIRHMGELSSSDENLRERLTGCEAWGTILSEENKGVKKPVYYGLSYRSPSEIESNGKRGKAISYNRALAFPEQGKCRLGFYGRVDTINTLPSIVQDYLRKG